MNLIAPQNFLFAGLIGIILLMYVLRLRRKERIVSSTLLWQTALRDLQANSPWQKLRSSLLMWLQILFLVLAVLALARPSLKVLAGGGQTIAIILDSSASMAATDVSPSRFGKAKAEANRLINAMSGGDEATLIAAGARTQVLAPLTANTNNLKGALSKATTQDTGCDLREAIVLASSLLKTKKNARVYVLSDGGVTPVGDLNTKNLELQFVKIGVRNNNLAVTAADARRGYGSTQAQVFATVHNYSDKAKTIDLQLSCNGSLIAVRPLTIPAKGRQSQLFDDIRFESGLFSVGFEEKDDLLSDNIAYANLDAPRAIKVLLLSSGNLFLEKAINVDPNVQLTRASTPGAASNSANYDVVVCDGIAPKNGDANQLVFNTFTALSPVEKVGATQAPSVADWDRKHPVTKFTSWNDVRFARAQAVKLKSWGQTIVESERTPLIVAGERGGKRIVWCGFDVRETDLPLRVAFPILVSSSLQWLTAKRGTSGESGAPTRAGDVVALSPPASEKEIRITRPDGSTLRVPVKKTPLLFSGTDHVGIYKASAGKDWSRQFGVSLLSKTESDLTPRDAIPIGEGKPIQSESRARANKELWGYLALVALALLGIEWWVYHRGV
jgi:hypothetical protein